MVIRRCGRRPTVRAVCIGGTLCVLAACGRSSDPPATSGVEVVAPTTETSELSSADADAATVAVGIDLDITSSASTAPSTANTTSSSSAAAHTEAGVSAAAPAPGTTPRSAPPDGPSTTEAGPVVVPGCERPWELAQVLDERALHDQLVGQWVACDAEVAADPGHVGYEFTHEGRWHELEVGDGTLARRRGWGHEGSWHLVDTSFMNGPGIIQLNALADGGGGIALGPFVWVEAPAERMRIGDTSGGNTFVRARATLPLPPPYPTTTTTVLGPSGCATAREGIEPTPDVATYRGLIVGRWAVCGDVRRELADSPGLEVAEDGTWSTLGWGPDGMLVPDGVRTGTWEAVDTSLMNGPGSFQLQLMWDGAWTSVLQTEFAANTPSVRFASAFGGFDAVRVEVP